MSEVVAGLTRAAKSGSALAYVQAAGVKHNLYSLGTGKLESRRAKVPVTILETRKQGSFGRRNQAEVSWGLCVEKHIGLGHPVMYSTYG